MADKSNIEWTDATWNPIVGCSVLSPGCIHCYAMKDAWRKHHNPKLPHYHGLTKKVNGNPIWTGVVREAPAHILTAPLHWWEPRRIFVNSMGDLFHESISDEAIDKVFDVMRDCPQHTFQVLTKRAERMCTYVDRRFDREADRAADNQILGAWPVPLLPNLWLGVSAEDQERADERIPHLLNTRAVVRFVSAEPLLGPIKFGAYQAEGLYINWLKGCAGTDPKIPGLDWVIVGGESGRRARPMHPGWARSIRDQCAAAGVAFFFKQWGEWGYFGRDLEFGQARDCMSYGPEAIGGPLPFGQYLVGKQRAGRLLDGRAHNDFPEATS